MTMAMLQETMERIYEQRKQKKVKTIIVDGGVQLDYKDVCLLIRKHKQVVVM